MLPFIVEKVHQLYHLTCKAYNIKNIKKIKPYLAKQKPWLIFKQKTFFFVLFCFQHNIFPLITFLEFSRNIKSFD